jgi:D-3-phosphoglycerate dehydrogenase
VVINTPAKNAASVAELTMTSIHQLFRGANVARSWLETEAISGSSHLDSTFVGGNFIAREPRGHILGLVGLGAIGGRVAKQAQFYGMTVLAHDPYTRGPIDDVELVSLERLLAESDVVSLHAPATESTRHIANTAFFAQMKPGAFFINTSRESLLDENALVDALDSGAVAGAVMDVCEPDGRWPELCVRPNVVVTPHLGGATIQTQERGIQMLIEDLQRWAAGELPLRRVA